MIFNIINVNIGSIILRIRLWWLISLESPEFDLNINKIKPKTNGLTFYESNQYVASTISNNLPKKKKLFPTNFKIFQKNKKFLFTPI